MTKLVRSMINSLGGTEAPLANDLYILVTYTKTSQTTGSSKTPGLLFNFN